MVIFLSTWSVSYTHLDVYKRQLKGLITNFSLNKLGGPVAMFQMSAQASENGLISILNLKMCIRDSGIPMSSIYPTDYIPR